MEKPDKMSFLTKLFQTRKFSRKHQCKWAASDHSKGWAAPSFNRDNVRLVVILQSHKHLNHSGRVLFDSKSADSRANTSTQDVKKRFCGKEQKITKNTKPPCGSPKGPVTSQEATTPCSRERRPRLASDIRVLEEMMFGSAPMKQKSSSLKVHTIKSPPQLMVTKVFVPTPSNKESNGEQESFDLYSIQSNSTESTPRQIAGSDRSLNSLISEQAQSVPVDVPRRSSEDNEDSGFSASVASTCSSNFTTSGYSPSSSASMTSTSSLKRRLRRNHATSLEYSLNKRFSDDTADLQPSSKRPSSLGIGITFSLPEDDAECFSLFESFFFSHVTLIESHVVKLKVAVEKALQKNSKHMTLEALDAFRNALYDLYTAPRLSEPVWLSMMSSTTHRVPLCETFLKEFMTVIDKYDTKNTKFFVSTLVTAVLTHHLAWVPTVTPAGASPSRTYLDKHSAKWLDALARSHPYNPLWAQLADLYGAIGFPLRLSKTVITGQKADLVCKLLHVLSYFIRCSEVHERTEPRQSLDFIDGHIDIPGTGMNTIEEDDTSESGETNSYRRYGSATSNSTVRHALMQTSTETVFSAKSDSTVIERTPDARKGVLSFKNARSMESESDVIRFCAKSGAVTGFKEDNGEAECHCEAEEGDEDRQSYGFCSKCQTLRRHMDVIQSHQKDWKYGNSVFYCCQDVLDASTGEHTSQCNFDLVNYGDFDKCSGSTCDESCKDGEHADSDSDARQQSGIVEETDQCSVNVVDSQFNIGRAASKPLLFFRMLSTETITGLTGEESICDKSSSDKYISESTELADKKLSLSIAKPCLYEKSVVDPVDSASKSRSSEAGALTESHASEPESIAGYRESKCRLSSTDLVEDRVRLMRVRHVGRMSETSFQEKSRFSFDEHAINKNGNKYNQSETENRAKSPFDVIERESYSDNKEEWPTTVTNSEVPLPCADHSPVDVIPHKCSKSPNESSSNLTGAVIDTASTLIQSPGSGNADAISSKQDTSADDEVHSGRATSPESMSPQLERTKTASSSSQSSCPSVYPSLNNLDDISTVDKTPSCQQEAQCTEGTNPTLSTVEEFMDEPGSVKLMKEDSGTLYPVIVGDTVITSVPEKCRSVSYTSPLTNSSISSFGAASDVAIKDSEDEVFLEDHSADICKTNESTEMVTKLESWSKLAILPSISEHFNDLGISMENERIPVESTELQRHHADIEAINLIDLTDPIDQQGSPVNAKVQAWLGSSSESGCQPCEEQLEIESEIIKEPQELMSATLGSISDSDIDKDTAACDTFTSSKPLPLRRGNSMFDEYFVDDSVQLPDPSIIESKSSFTACTLCNKSLALNTCVFRSSPSAAAIQESDDPLCAECKSKDVFNFEGTMSMMDEYFTEDPQTLSLPEGPTKDLVTSTITLMQESRQMNETAFIDSDELNMDDLLEPQTESRSRSNSESSLTRSKHAAYDRQHSGGSVISRQNSQPAPARCRPVTPTELGRRRHTSATSSLSWEIDLADTVNKMKDIPMPTSVNKPEKARDDTVFFDRNFGHSLMAGYTDHYMSDFVLHGTSDSNFLTKLHTDLNISAQNSVLDDPITEACCIVADTDKWTVRRHSCRCVSADRMQSVELSTSQMVSSILESVHKLWKLKMSPEFCLMHLEDRLQEIYFKSKMLSEYIRVHRKIDFKELSTVLGFDTSDLPLLLAVAGTHTQHFALGLIS